MQGENCGVPGPCHGSPCSTRHFKVKQEVREKMDYFIKCLKQINENYGVDPLKQRNQCLYVD